MDIDLTMYQEVKKASKEVPLGLALYYQGKRITFKKFVNLIDKMADILVNKLGVQKGDTVLIAQPNIPDTLIIFYAVNKIGAIANLVHPFTPYNQVKSIFEKTHSKVAFLFEQRVAKEVESYRGFADKIFVTRIENYLPFYKKIFYHLFMNGQIRKKLGKYHGSFKGFKYSHKLKPSHFLVEEVKNDASKTSVLLHSGSTTGKPKTICLNNNAFNFMGEHAAEYVCVSQEFFKGKTMLAVLPSFHGFGLGITMHAPLMNGFGLVMVPKFTVKSVIDGLNHTKMVVATGTPTMYEKLISDPSFCKNPNLENLMVCFCGGDSLNPTFKEKFDRIMREANSRCQIFEGYGLTEAIAVNCVNTFDHNKLGSIGYPGSGYKFKIIDENEEELPPRQTGEICIFSPSAMLGYFEDEEATKATFTNDGYLKTGDIGYIDEDGFIFFKSRKKRVVKVSGVGVFPSEIEALIETVPGVSAACAIRIPDPQLISAIKVFVIAKYFDEEGMKRNIIETCQKYLIRWAVPKEIEFRNELPLTLLNKIDFKVLQEEEDKKRGLK